MPNTLPELFFQLTYLFTHVTPTDAVDVALVSLVFFVAFQALRLRRAFQLLQGAIILAVLTAALLLILPLNTFNWLLRGMLLAGLIALPLLFQEELRRALTGLANVGRRRRKGASVFGEFVSTLVSSISHLAEQRHGALIVLEGETPLDEIIATGILIQAHRMSPQLLETIFHPNTPLHDGAVILRDDRVAAASCILPVETQKTGPVHLGTRHRAAIGLSAEVPDSLVIVVSEETGLVSVVQEGRMRRGLSPGELAQSLDRYQDRLTGQRGPRWGWLWGGSLGSLLRNLAIALLLGIVAWVLVVYQTNPPLQTLIEGVRLNVIPPPEDLIRTSTLPGSIDVLVQTTQDDVSGLDADAVQAQADLSGLSADVHQVLVQVSLADPRAQVVAVTPASINVSLEPRLVIERNPTVVIVDVDSLPVGYALGDLQVTPSKIMIEGPRSAVERVSSVQVQLNLSGRFTGFQQSLGLRLLDASGEEISELTPNPESVVVDVPIRQTLFTRGVGVQADLVTSSLDELYQVSFVRIDPPEVLLAGLASTVEESGEFITTAPINLEGVNSDFTLDVALVLPDMTTAFNAEGEAIATVSVSVGVRPVTGYLVRRLIPSANGLPEGWTADLSPRDASLLLIGPQPLLSLVEQDPNLVSIQVDVAGLPEGEHLLPVEVLAPEGVQAESFPAEIRVTLTSA